MFSVAFLSPVDDIRSKIIFAILCLCLIAIIDSSQYDERQTRSYNTLDTPVCPRVTQTARPCPTSDSNFDWLMRLCHYRELCDPEFEPICIQVNGLSIYICSEKDLTCPPGIQRSVWIDNNSDPKYLMVLEKPCSPENYQITYSGCYDACQNLHLTVKDIPEEFLVYSYGDTKSPTWIYCNYLKGFYSRDGKFLLDYDQELKFNRDFCINVTQHDPCIENQYPLPNRTCVSPCEQGSYREVSDGFICKPRIVPETVAPSSKSSNSKTGNDSYKIHVILWPCIGGGAIIVIIVVVVCKVLKKKRRQDGATSSNDERNKILNDIDSRWKFKKELNDLINQPFSRCIPQLMESTGAIMYKAKVIGTVFRAGHNYLISAYHVVERYITDPRDNTTNYELLERNTDIRVHFGASACENSTHHRVKMIFGNMMQDFAVLQITTYFDIPKPLFLWRHPFEYLNMNHVLIIGYGYKESPDEKFSEKCPVISYSRQSARFDEMIKYLNNNKSHFKRAIEMTNGDASSVDRGYRFFRDSDHIILDMFMEKGSSGAPLLTLEERSPKIVGIVLGGQPECFFVLPASLQEKFPKKFRYEVALKMEDIYNTINRDKPDLASNLFNSYAEETNV